MSTNIAKPVKVAIIGASGTYGEGILARAEEVGVQAVVITRSPHKFPGVKPTTTVVEAQLHEVEKLREAFRGCDGVISALGDDRKKRPKTHNLPHVWSAMKAAGVTKYVGMASGAMMMPGERRGGFQRAVHPLLSVLKLFGVDMLEQNEWERDSLLRGRNGADGITWVITRVVRPTRTPFVGAYAHRDKRGPLDCSIYDHGDFCLYCVASSEWDELAPHVSSGPPPDATQEPTGSAKRRVPIETASTSFWLRSQACPSTSLLRQRVSTSARWGKTIQLSDGRTLACLDTGDPEGRPVFHFHGEPGSIIQAMLEAWQ